jgi:trk system potassium uptake protein TrkH
MINSKIIFKIMGSLLFIETAMLALAALFPLFYGEDDLWAFLLTIVGTGVSGYVFRFLGRGAEKHASRKDGYIIVSIAWVVFSLFGMMPFYLSGYVPSIANAFFEAMSGFTSTGATILDNIEELPHGLLFWRSLTQWVGGMGIVFFTIAVLPIFGVGGIQLFAAEATGPTHNKLHPRIGVTAKWLWSLYLGMTLVGMVLLMLGGMDWFDGLNHAMTATSTGGFSTKQDSIAFYHSAYIEYVLILLMFLSGINFSLLFFTLLRGRFRKLFEDTEFRWYAGTVLGFSLFCTAVLIAYGSSDWERSFRDALFQVVSVQTTTGYASADYMLWPPVLWLVISFVMYFGACAGSTSGAIKCVRIAILAQIVRNQFKRILHPNAVLPIRISHQVVPTVMQSTLLAFMVVYMLAVFFGWLLVMSTGVDFMESYSIVVSSVGNVGPALGHYGPAYSWNALPDAAKWICSFLMLIGRLELFSVLLLFTSGFWKKH